jgi:uncharacterized membrane protein YhaH (DUF805 family)
MGGVFSMTGRYNRSKYIWTSLGIAVVANVLSFILGMVVGGSGGDTSTAQALSLFISIPTAVIGAFQSVKRLHDLGRPGSHYWLLLIPFYNIYIAIILLFQKGTVGDNQFGPDPLA